MLPKNASLRHVALAVNKLDEYEQFYKMMRSTLLEQNDQLKNTGKARRTKNDGAKLLLVLMMVANIGMAQQPDQVADATALWMGSAATRLTGTFPLIPLTPLRRSR